MLVMLNRLAKSVMKQNLRLVCLKIFEDLTQPGFVTVTFGEKLFDLLNEMGRFWPSSRVPRDSLLKRLSRPAPSPDG